MFNRPFECVVECYFNGVTHSGFERTSFVDLDGWQNGWFWFVWGGF
ncbi:hypothetical protein BAZOLSSOX_1586 [uncultured Gammaproteobacteria bacterium]|nr:hypothetical protein BAZOLSSOX_1586 [uncultured Gammaproteobacteria bacterium]